jgi:hypothetical protein
MDSTILRTFCVGASVRCSEMNSAHGRQIGTFGTAKGSWIGVGHKRQRRTEKPIEVSIGYSSFRSPPVEFGNPPQM